MAKVLLVRTYLEVPTHPSQELQLWILISGSELPLSYYYQTLTMQNLWFYSLVWLKLFHYDPHRQLFSLKNGFLFQNQLFYVQSIILWLSDGKYCDCASCWFFTATYFSVLQSSFRQTFLVKQILWTSCFLKKLLSELIKNGKVNLSQKFLFWLFAIFTVECSNKNDFKLTKAARNL